MGTRTSINYKLIKDYDEMIELEDYAKDLKHIKTSSELSYHCQKLIVLGYPLEAYNLLKTTNLDPNQLFFHFHVQEFIELIKKKKLIQAIQLAQQVFPGFRSSKLVLNSGKTNLVITVNDVMGLLCYENPEQSPLSYLLDTQLRNSLSSAVDLFLNPPSKTYNICKKLCCCRRRPVTKVNTD